MSKRGPKLRPATESACALGLAAESDERWQLALEAADFALWDWDLSTGHLRWEGHGLGFANPPETFDSTRASVFDLLHPDDREALRCLLDETSRTGKSCRLELRMLHPDGGLHWMALHGRAYRDAEQRPTRFVGVVRDITERRTIETTLRESEERFRRLAEQSPDIIFRAGADGLEYVSPASLTIVGVNPEERYRQSLLPGHIHPDDQCRIPDIVAALQRGPVRCELRMVHADGHTLWTEHHLHPIRSPTGEVIAVEGIVRDITERKRADEILRREARTLEGVHDAVISTDMEGVVSTWNPAAERLCGYTAAEAIGRNVEFLWFPEDLPLYQDVVLQPTLQKGTHEVVVRCRRKDGEEIFIVLRLTLLRDEHDRAVGIIGCSNDITDRMNAEEALRKQREDLQVILDSVPAFIWYKDDHNRILRTNRAAAESMGTSIAALEGRSSYDIYPEEAAKYHRDDLEVIRSGRPRFGIIEPLQTASGEKRWIRTDKIPCRNERGEIVGVIVFAVDVTERVRAEEALQQARDELEQRVEERTGQLARAVESLRSEIVERQRAEERARHHQAALAHVLRLRTVEGMAGQLAHEINQPLAAIANFANGLTTRIRGGAIDAAVVQEAAEQISRQALRAGQVIHRLRDFVRKDVPTRERCDLNHVVQEAVHLVEADARQQGVALRLVLDPQAPGVEIDPIQIEQVVLNLLHNGLEAIDAERNRSHEILVETRLRDDGHVEVRVRDTGRGLPARDAKRAFEPFFTTKKSGLGMGLSISRSIVEAHRGTLWVTRNKDRGTTFAFSLPVAARTREHP